MDMLKNISDKSLAAQVAVTTAVMGLTTSAFADSTTALINDDGQSAYASDTLGGGNVTGSFLDGEGGGVEGIETSMGNLTKVVIAVFALIGFFLAGYGLYILYKASQPNSQSKAGNGFIAIAIGSALAILPYIVFSGGNTLTNFAG